MCMHVGNKSDFPCRVTLLDYICYSFKKHNPIHLINRMTFPVNMMSAGAVVY